jgi:lipoprotein-anchoring transpeptidase ErfK/SrfK
MRRRRVAITAAAAALVAAGTVLTREGDDPGVPPRLAPAPQSPRVRTPPSKPPPRGPLGALVVRRTQLRATPGGRVVRTIGTRTGYGSVRVLAVVERRGRWLGVLSDHMPNSRPGWIPAPSAKLLHEPYRLDVDLSARRILVRREGRVVRRVRVAIGLPGTPTPTGRFAVTDALRIGKGYPQYGCCALALTGRQPNVPQGWSGGDRLAIHGTTRTGTIGSPASFGCLRASDADMRWLIRKVTLGAQVVIRA